MNITGETNGIKKNLIEEIGLSLEGSFGGEFIPYSLADILCDFTLASGREIAVVITRHGHIKEAVCGLSDSARIPAWAGRNSKIRIIHTHPGTDPSLSTLDISLLTVFGAEAVTALALSKNGEKKCSIVYSTDEGLTELDDINIEEANSLNIFRIVDKDRQIRRSESTISENKEKVLLAGSGSKNLEELKKLTYTAGAEVVGIVEYKETSERGRYYVGSGKIEEIEAAVQNTGADTVIFDDELKSSQIRNIQQEINAKILDRTALILDIFASRAKSREGKLQVHLAQLKYRNTHLTGHGTELSRLGGGIGTRGPGETKLETDRRHIKNMIRNIEQELEKVRRTRGMHRELREKNNMKTAVLTGYTNSGKSSLLNALTGSDVYVEDKLFATLDTTTRKLELKSGRGILLSDTVGFINKLPHDLIEAFKATLEEAASADLVLLVLDASDPAMFEQLKISYALLSEIGAAKKPIITVLNKTDITGHEIDRRIYSFKEYKTRYAYVSATKKTGLDELKKIIDHILFLPAETVTERLQYKEASRVSFLHENYSVISEEYTEDEIIVTYEAP